MSVKKRAFAVAVGLAAAAMKCCSRWLAARAVLAVALVGTAISMTAAAIAAGLAAVDPATQEKINQLNHMIDDLNAQEASVPAEMRPAVEKLKEPYLRERDRLQGKSVPSNEQLIDAKWARPAPRVGPPLDPSLFLAHPDWAKSLERLEGGPEAELVVRVGSVSNFIYGFPPTIDPFSGASTAPHGYPWDTPKGTPSGLKRIMVGSGVGASDLHRPGADGYSAELWTRDTQVQPVLIPVGQLPSSLDRALLQFFIDDFQAPAIHSHFQATVNGIRLPNLETALNTVDQTGPTGKLITVPLLPEYFPALRSGTLTILIDDPLTHAPDGYALDFVRLIINPHKLRYTSSLRGTVRDADTGKTLAGATVTAPMASDMSNVAGTFSLNGIPSGLIVAMASKEGYAPDTQGIDVLANETGQAAFALRRNKEDATSLEQQIAKSGIAALYGIHFDLDKDTLRPDSESTLQAVLALMRKDPSAHWVVSGHTDNTGAADHNAALSRARAQAVCRWLQGNGIDARVLLPEGQGAGRPVADNATVGGRALNRRVELQRRP